LKAFNKYINVYHQCTRSLNEKFVKDVYHRWYTWHGTC